jgi:hypothetical protein
LTISVTTNWGIFYPGIEKDIEGFLLFILEVSHKVFFCVLYFL